MRKKYKFRNARMVLAVSVLAIAIFAPRISAPLFASGREQAIVMGKNSETKEVWITIGRADDIKRGQLCYVTRGGKEIAVLKVSRIFETFSVAEAIDIMSFGNIQDKDVVLDRNPSMNEALLMETLVEEISGMKKAGRAVQPAPGEQKAAKAASDTKNAPEEALRERIAKLELALNKANERIREYQKKITELEAELKSRDENKLRLMDDLKRIKVEYFPAEEKSN